MNMTRSFFFRALTGTAALLTFAACGGGGGGGGSTSGGGSSTPWTEDYSQHPGITDPGQVAPNADSPLVGITMSITDTVGTEETRKDVLKFEQNGGGSISITKKKEYGGERTYSGSINTYTYTRISAGQARLHVEAGWTETGWPAGDIDEETRDYVITFTSATRGTIGINAPGSTSVTFEKTTTTP